MSDDAILHASILLLLKRKDPLTFDNIKLITVEFSVNIMCKLFVTKFLQGRVTAELDIICIYSVRVHIFLRDGQEKTRVSDDPQKKRSACWIFFSSKNLRIFLQVSKRSSYMYMAT